MNVTPDLYWLALTGLMTAALWMPHVLRLIVQEGVIPAFRDPEALIEPDPKWAQRSKRAHINAQLNFAVFAGLVVAAHLAGVDVKVLGTLTMVYFFVRLAHYLVYTLGLPYLRPNLFVIGAVIQIIIALKIMQVL